MKKKNAIKTKHANFFYFFQYFSQITSKVIDSKKKLYHFNVLQKNLNYGVVKKKFFFCFWSWVIL